MLTLNDGRSELWQWDTGRKLTVDAECSQVHFSNKVFGRSVDVDVENEEAAIPDVLLQSEKDICAWAFVGTAENGYTKISKVFKVNKRNKPADYVFTPTDQTTLEEIKEKLDYLESTQGPDAIKNAVEDYLKENPVVSEESDPTVPEWAKQPEKPRYTAKEIGALPDDTQIPEIPKNVSAFENDAGYLIEHQDLSDYAKKDEIPSSPADIGAQPVGDYALRSELPIVPVRSVNGKTGDVRLTAEDVNALPEGTPIPSKTSDLSNDSGFVTVAVATLLNYYLKSETFAKSETYSRTDIDNLINGLESRLDAFFDTDDETLDQMSELVAYINSNKSLIDAITTSKVSVSDIINNLTTSVENKPLGAAQGVVLKNLIDALGESKLDATSLPEAINTALAQAKESGEFDGADGTPGKDGISATHSWNGTVLTVTSASGTSSADLKGEKGNDGYTPIKGVDYFDGLPGDPGKDGTSVTVSNVTESTADGGSNVVTFSDGKTLTVKNGSKGSQGEKGEQGEQGIQGIQGIQGEKGDKGEQGIQGIQGVQGEPGADGAKGDKGDPGEKGETGAQGPAGYTPQKGTDYWTAADKAAMVSDVLAALPTWTGGSY